MGGGGFRSIVVDVVVSGLFQIVIFAQGSAVALCRLRGRSTGRGIRGSCAFEAGPRGASWCCNERDATAID